MDTLSIQLLAPTSRLVRCERFGDYHWTEVSGLAPCQTYLLQLDDGTAVPDPASRYQPEGVHRASAVTDPGFAWTDQGWRGLTLDRYVLYELHAGTFTADGTFEAIIPHLDELRDLGITAIELMPVAQFPGSRNWGYDGVGLFAAQNSYGGPSGLRTLANACHERGVAVVLDVVFNHLGPEGNYLSKFGPYFTERHHTPWGPAVNFDGPDSDEVRRYFIESALYWVTDCHIDALRLDAVHAIPDASPVPFLAKLSEAVHERGRQLNRRIHLFPESPDNNARLLRSRDLGGCELDAQWNDDFHHALRSLLSGETKGYYADYGEISHLEKSWRDAWVYTGQYSCYRRRSHGSPSHGLSGERFVVFSQNHDHVGNRMLGERPGRLLPADALRSAAACVILSPYIPMLFMGEEYDDPAPFLYFTSHGDANLAEAVRRGRKEEFASFAWQGEPPDPQSEETFLRSKLQRDLRRNEPHASLHAWYKELLRLRREHPALARLSRDSLTVSSNNELKILAVHRWEERSEVFILLSFSADVGELPLALPQGAWRLLLDSRERRFGGAGNTALHSLPSSETSKILFGNYAVAVFGQDGRSFNRPAQEDA